MIYNFDFTGSPIWDLFSKEAIMLENSWNTAVRIMFDLPLQTHRYFIEPISGVRHLKFVLVERFLSFLEQITKSRKTFTKHVLKYVKHDVRSVTGSNLRNILLMTNRDNIEEITTHDVKKLKYHEVTQENVWKIDFIKELIAIKNNQASLNDFSKEELDVILTNLCTN